MDAAHYRCEATSIAGFIQQVAVGYVAHGYFFYVSGCIPGEVDPKAVDAKLIAKYDIARSKWSRARRRRAGSASMQYIRLGRHFLLLCTHGAHRFFTDEHKSVRDCRRVPIKRFGYAISYKRGHAHVRIERGEFTRLKASFAKLALHRHGDRVADALSHLPYEPSAPVRRQLLELLRIVNSARRAAGYAPVGVDCLRFHRRIVRPFGTAIADNTGDSGGSSARARQEASPSAALSRQP